MFGSATFAIVVSSACIKVASITDTTSRPRLATSRCVLSGVMTGSETIRGSVRAQRHACLRLAARALDAPDHRMLLAGIDFHIGTHAGAQDRTAGSLVDAHAHRNALHDL